VSDSTVKIYKLFWADQDVEQEQWLREQARQGLHLRAVNVLCRWTFEKGAPADVVYRVDYQQRANDADYCLLFQDAGWERAAEITGWQYWRKPVVDGRAPEILSDSESKIARFHQVLWLLALAISPMLIMLVSSDKHSTDNVGIGLGYVVQGTVVLIIPLYGYMAMRLFRRIRTLRASTL